MKHLLSCKEKQNLLSEQKFNWGETGDALLMQLVKDM